MGVSPAGGPRQRPGSYQGARPGYEIRSLVTSANILARHGQQQACETCSPRRSDIYKVYAGRSAWRPYADDERGGWRQRQIAGAQPVTDKDASFRSDELIGTDVRSAQGDALGSVEDLVMSPQTGKIAYMVVARGGIFGIR